MRRGGRRHGVQRLKYAALFDRPTAAGILHSIPNFQGVSAMLRKVALVAAGLMLVGVGSPRADEAVLDQLYGNGVHYYFGNDYSRAYDSLSSAIRGGSKDPRAYYFRGLAELRLGREPDATADFSMGASLEATDANGRYFVGQALERVQGPTRKTLEQYRENARAIALERNIQNQQSVFSQQQGAESQVLRRSAPPVEMTPAPIPDRVAKPTLPPEGAPAKAPAVTAGKAAAEKTDAADPFAPAAADKKPAAEPAPGAAPGDQAPGDDPFKTPAAKPAAPAAEKPAAGPAEKPDDNDPFKSNAKPADNAPADKAPTDKAPAKPDANDPFKSDAKPADKSDAAPAAKSAADDKPVKAQPGAVHGIFKALVGAMPGGNSNAAAPATAAPNAAATPPSSTASAPPQKTPMPAAGASDDPFAAAPGVATKPPAPPADPPAAAAAPKDAGPAAAAPTTPKKAADPFADEPPAKQGPDAKAADTPPAAKSPAPTDKSAPDMKKDNDPFKN